MSINFLTSNGFVEVTSSPVPVQLQDDDDVSSNAEEENKLESELLQVANDQRWRARLRRRKVVPFRRDRFIKNPGQWKLKPKRKGFFASILQFFKNLW